MKKGKMDLSHHVEALERVNQMTINRAIFEVKATWLIDSNSVTHVRSHDGNEENITKIQGSLEDFISSRHCVNERCATWVNAIGDEVIVAAQIAVAVVEAWALIEALERGVRVMGRVEAINLLAAPFDRVDTITGGHSLVDAYRFAAQAEYGDRQISYINDLSNAKKQVCEAAVDYLGHDRGVFTKIHSLMSGSEKSNIYIENLPTTRNDLSRLKLQVGKHKPKQLSQFDFVKKEKIIINKAGKEDNTDLNTTAIYGHDRQPSRSMTPQQKNWIVTCKLRRMARNRLAISSRSQMRGDLPSGCLLQALVA